MELRCIQSSWSGIYHNGKGTGHSDFPQMGHPGTQGPVQHHQTAHKREYEMNPLNFQQVAACPWENRSQGVLLHTSGRRYRPRRTFLCRAFFWSIVGISQRRVDYKYSQRSMYVMYQSSYLTPLTLLFFKGLHYSHTVLHWRSAKYLASSLHRIRAYITLQS